MIAPTLSRSNVLFPMFFLLACLSLNAYGKERTQNVTLITDNNYQPYSYVEDGEAKGKTIDWIKTIDEAIPQFTITLKPMPWREGLIEVREGRALGIVGTYFSAHHRPWIYPYSQPLFSETVEVLCRPDVSIPSPAQWPESFAGVLMLNIAGYDGWLDFKTRDRANTQIMNFFEVPSVEIAYRVLAKKNADCMLSEQAFTKIALESDPREDSLKPIVITTVSKKPIYIGYSHKAIADSTFANALEFAKAFDFALYQLKQQGKLVD